MAARGGRNNIVARRVMMTCLISVERVSPPKTSMILSVSFERLNWELEALVDIREVFDLVMELRDDRCDEQDKVADFNRLIAVVRRSSLDKEIDWEMLQAEGNVLSFECVAPLCLSVVAVGCAIRYSWECRFWFLVGKVYSEVLLHRLSFGRIHWFSDYMDEYNHVMNDYILEVEGGIQKEARDKLWDEITVKSAAAKMARSKSVYQDTMGRDRYALVKEKMVRKREVMQEDQLDNERHERQKKELLIQNLSNKMSQTEGMVTKLKNQLAAQGGQFQSMSTQLKPPNSYPGSRDLIGPLVDLVGMIGAIQKRYENCDLAHLKSFSEFHIYNVWEVVQYDVSMGWIRV
ncbi:hypothetical protein Tco_0907692, partial [Tanacetum coccineum]